MDDQTLNTWAIRFRDGDEASFRTLVDTLTRTLIAMAYRYTDDWEWARDLTQETWIRVYEHIGRYDPARSFATWLHSVHRNGCLDHVRRRWVGRESTPGARAMVLASGAAPDDPSAEVERREFRERVLAATGHLTESQRRIFVRVDVEEEGQAEVARELGIRPGTLRTTLHFARRKMAALMRATEGDT